MRDKYESGSIRNEYEFKEYWKMCYLIAKDRNAHGCFALKTNHGKHLAELKEN